MLYLKACPRCRGDVKFAVDIDGPFVQCLQCGFTLTAAHGDVIAARMAPSPTLPADARTADTGRDRVHAAS